MNNSQEPSISATAEPEPKLRERAGANVAVNSCIRAWQRAYSKEFASTEDDYEAEKAALKAFRRALPPLAGHENIRDFIACVTYASVNEIIQQIDANHYLEAAKIALGVERTEPRLKNAAPKRLGRPPKISPARKNK